MIFQYLVIKKPLANVSGIIFGFIFLIICGYAIYLNLSLENTKIKLEQEKEDNKNLKIAIQDTVIAFNELLAIEKDKNSLQVEALKDKEQLVVASEKVQNALKKYKEKTSNETIKKNCPKPVPFSF